MSCVVQDIEAVDPEYYKNLKWMLENNITDVLDLTFTEESDYFGKKELVELKPGGKDIRSVLLTTSHVINASPLQDITVGGVNLIVVCHCRFIDLVCHQR